MRRILQNRAMRWIFAANLVSMIGSGMNAAAVFWHILQMTHSEMSLGKLLLLQTLPALVLLPFSGVVIDREDRRHLILWLDFARGSITLAVAILALRGEVQTWHLYTMFTLVSAGFWMFWPTMNALLQEVTPADQYVNSNTVLMASFQGGWLIAGALVGFVYDHIGLGWILVIDFATYVVSFICYYNVRKGRHVASRFRPEDAGVSAAAVPAAAGSESVAAEGSLTKYFHELAEGLRYLKGKPHLQLLGTGWALFIGAMLTQGAVTAPLSDRIMHAGAVGYGWFNGGWGVGAFTSALYSPWLIGRFQAHRSAGIALGTLAVGLVLLPFSHFLGLAVFVYIIMGSGRGVTHTAIASEMMGIVPKHFMGRVQNIFYLGGTILQLFLGIGVATVAHRISLTLAFACIGGIYALACAAAMWPVERHAKSVPASATETT
jgi:MFS family permease